MATAGMATIAGGVRRLETEWLGEAPATEQDAVRLVEAGLPTDVVERFLHRGLTRAEVFSLVLPLRTWKHRKSRKEALSPTESERALRVARVLAKAEVVLGEAAAAMSWMRAPKRRFQGRTPMQMLGTEPGGRLVEQLLYQIDDGIFA